MRESPSTHAADTVGKSVGGRSISRLSEPGEHRSVRSVKSMIRCSGSRLARYSVSRKSVAKRCRSSLRSSDAARRASECFGVAELSPVSGCPLTGRLTSKHPEGTRKPVLNGRSSGWRPGARLAVGRCRAPVEVGELASRSRGRPVVCAIAFAAVKTAVDGSTSAGLAGNEDPPGPQFVTVDTAAGEGAPPTPAGYAAN